MEKINTPLDLAIAEINAGIIRCQQEELRYRFSGYNDGAETEKEKRIELERIKKDIESLLPRQQEIIEQVYNSGVEMGESYINNYGYDKFISSEDYFTQTFKSYE